jgi:hypothetical protein
MWLYVVNLIMVAGVFIFGLVSWQRTDAHAYLYIGIGFLCFAISHAFKLANAIVGGDGIAWLASGQPFDWVLIVVRIIGYLLCLYAVISAK